ncbi:MAG: hypothetical protein RMK35_06030 [Aquificaceae bacterium]|nr:hypothetical protein [Aquificaceae bacterium]
MREEVFWEKLLKEGFEIFRVFKDCLSVEVVGFEFCHRGSIRELC